MIRQECRLKQLGLDYGSPRDFVVSRWERDRVSGGYITYRFVVAGFLYSILVANGSTDTRPELWFIYLTDLGLLTQTLHLVLSAALTVQYLLRFKKGSEDRMTLLAKCSWVLYNVTNITTLLITVVYWAFIYNPEKGLDAMNFMIHAVNSIVCLIDMFVGARPYRLLHFYQPTIALTVYFIFTVIYWAAGGLNASGQNYIYAILDWNKPKQTTPLVILGLIFLLPFFHALLWSLHKLRDRQWRFYKVGSIPILPLK